MNKIEEIKCKLAKLEELEEKQFEEKQALLKSLRKAEQEEKETKFMGKPQLFRFNGGYGGNDYIAAITKEEAVSIFKEHYPSAKNVKEKIETLGLQVIHFECEATR